MSGYFSSTGIIDVARKAIATFAHEGLKCCLVGSVASYAYGVSRALNVSKFFHNRLSGALTR